MLRSAACVMYFTKNAFVLVLYNKVCFLLRWLFREGELSNSDLSLDLCISVKQLKGNCNLILEICIVTRTMSGRPRGDSRYIVIYACQVMRASEDCNTSLISQDAGGRSP